MVARALGVNLLITGGEDDSLSSIRTVERCSNS